MERVTSEDVLNYFYNLVKSTPAFSGFQCSAGNVYNMDETSFWTSGKSKMVVAVKGSKEVWSTEPDFSYHMTVVAAVAADGTAVPPAFILLTQSVETSVLDDCPVAGALVTSSAKAFITGDLFNSSLIRFGEWKLKERKAAPAILIIDNCSSHVESEETHTIALDYGIKIVPLPPNATHLLQPLDVAVFRSFKTAISRRMTRELRALNTSNLPRRTAIKIAGAAYNDIVVPQSGLTGRRTKEDRCHQRV